MYQTLKDTAGLGAFFWLIGYVLSLVLYFVVPLTVMGWIIFCVLTPLMVLVTIRWFRGRTLPLSYYAVLAIAWTLIAVVCDYLFIVLLFGAQGYYHASVLAYYAVTFLVPAGVGMYLQKSTGK